MNIEYTEDFISDIYNPDYDIYIFLCSMVKNTSGIKDYEVFFDCPITKLKDYTYLLSIDYDSIPNYRNNPDGVKFGFYNYLYLYYCIGSQDSDKKLAGIIKNNTEDFKIIDYAKNIIKIDLNLYPIRAFIKIIKLNYDGDIMYGIVDEHRHIVPNYKESELDPTNTFNAKSILQKLYNNWYS